MSELVEATHTHTQSRPEIAGHRKAITGRPKHEATASLPPRACAHNENPQNHTTNKERTVRSAHNLGEQVLGQVFVPAEVAVPLLCDHLWSMC